ncbi:hypothetical protein [Desulfonatronospira sp.]|uniref:DUF6414 family protein n=1 Tax=Desulfonatronospira sp. TaxID=1962951 RepID=UPI0025B9821A|nr:hypothetical protein [Desulfonatronospira sp.]
MATLYDFLYIDHERVKSIYAQLFSGLLGAIENVASESRTKSSEGQIGGSPLGHALLGSSATQNESKLEMLDPHDLILRDVLQGLHEENFIVSDTSSISPGNFILLNGTVSILDLNAYKHFIGIMPQFLEQPVTAPKKGKDKQIHKHHQKQAASLSQLISDVVPWSLQVIIEDKRSTAWGAINGNNLRDAPGNLMLKHGSTLVGEWYILGIVDALANQFGQKNTSFPEALEGLAQASEGIRAGFGRPDNFVGITPLLIFRKLLK